MISRLELNLAAIINKVLPSLLPLFAHALLARSASMTLGENLSLFIFLFTAISSGVGRFRLSPQYPRQPSEVLQ